MLLFCAYGTDTWSWRRRWICSGCFDKTEGQKGWIFTLLCKMLRDENLITGCSFECAEVWFQVFPSCLAFNGWIEHFLDPLWSRKETQRKKEKKNLYHSSTVASLRPFEPSLETSPSFERTFPSGLIPSYPFPEALWWTADVRCPAFSFESWRYSALTLWGAVWIVGAEWAEIQNSGKRTSVQEPPRHTSIVSYGWKTIIGHPV